MNRITKITAVAVAILTVVVGLAVIVLGIVTPNLAHNTRLLNTADNPLPFIIAVYAGCVAALAFLAELMLIMITVRKGNPFVKRNVSALRRMGLYCLIATALLVFLGIIYDGFSIYITAFILFFGSLCAFALSGVFARAVEYKDENDLTV